MRRFSQRSSLVTLSEINITPLLDLAFVLLIIFVITTPLLDQGMSLKLPSSATAQPDKPLDRKDIRMVEIDPETNQIATGLCPQHERVAILSTGAPTSECYQHNIYFDLGSDPVINDASTVARAAPRLPRTREPGESHLLRDTRVETDVSGRKTLVNELRAIGR